MKKNIILGILAALIVLSFYLLDNDIKKYEKVIDDQQSKLSELEYRIDSQKNILLFQGSRIRELEKGNKIIIPKNQKHFTAQFKNE
jgi:cell division protein FtsL